MYHLFKKLTITLYIHNYLSIYTYKWCKVNFSIYLSLLTLSIDVIYNLAMFNLKKSSDCLYILNSTRIVSSEPLGSRIGTNKQ